MQIEYDPNEMSYKQILEVFFSQHNPHRRQYSVQYRSAIFYHNDDQKQTALEMKNELEKETGKTVHTSIEEAGTFWIAEDYHQKYQLRSKKSLFSKIKFADNQEVLDSELAAKLNGYCGGWGNGEEFLELEEMYGWEIPEGGRDIVIDMLSNFKGSSAYCPYTK